MPGCRRPPTSSVSTICLDRKPKELSGGQRQRVAVGRAIVRKPKLFLFDEPLSNLDAKLRVAMRAEISKLHRRLGATIIYVTHDQVEAMTMADRIFIMNKGLLQQSGAPMEVYSKPANRFVAGFIGSPAMNFIDARAIAANGSLFIDAGDFRVRVPESFHPRLRPYAGRQVVFGVRPEDIAAHRFVGRGRRRKHGDDAGRCRRNARLGDIRASDVRCAFASSPGWTCRNARFASAKR